ncbi:hypothetical protein VTH06DRAFT_2865 [Thermothelomyces fergusii]
MANTLRASNVVPAQLGFLAIYNPSLGTTDETVDDQIVYYASANTLSNAKERRRLLRAARDGHPIDSISSEERNERLRQIGLAQGMVEFARGFSGGTAVDSIDTERARVVLHELEPGWWILASVDLTRLPLPPSKAPPAAPPASSPPQAQTRGTAPQQPPAPKYEYSAREVKPPALLLRDLLRAHSLFLLHHGPSLSTLYSALPRPQFVAALARYWDSFLLTWNVLLHGNPARDVLWGIKVAASGELGMGVGEEDRGSGEREVLEGMAGGAVAGLVDLVVGRYGDADVAEKDGTKSPHAGGAGGGGSEHQDWLGCGADVGAEDGAVFLGVGALSRRSLRAVTDWMEDVFTWGESAYGVADGLAAARLRAKRRRRGERSGGSKTSPSRADNKTQKKGKSEPGGEETGGGARKADRNVHANTSTETGEAGGGMDKVLSYLTFGYGTYWSLGTTSPAANSDTGNESLRDSTATEDTLGREPPRVLDDGYFLLGLDEPKTDPEQPELPSQGGPATPKIVTVELEPDNCRQRHPNNAGPPDPATLYASQPRTVQLRPVIYIHRPFIYILLFEPTTAVLPGWEEFSQSLHSQLTTLHKALLSSTAYRPEKPLPASLQSEIYDLVFDPKTLTIHSTIPNIPEPVFVANPSPGGLFAPPPPPPPKSPSTTAPWTRVEALNTHNQILSIFASSRGDAGALERTCKTSRGWWVVWSRVLEQGATSEADRRPPSPGGSDASPEDAHAGDGSGCADGPAAVGKEIFLVRRASDQDAGAASYVGGGGGSAGWAEGASRLAQGIGVDTKRYIEGLLSLNR